ncbi:MAG: transporter substrate-binding domain-containing protein [Nitrospirae bacterium]|nr:transporter substrate-binding domain-containing protein [Nitrospirota bacterium]MBF0615824.1 transporter substrate-binding domain-containing protein [Nitrospirota bacterium]
MRKQPVIKFLLSAIIVFGVLFCVPCRDTACAQQKQTLILNSSFRTTLTSPDKTGFLDLIYKELAKRMGIEIIIQYLPSERAIKNADRGIEDGDICRIYAINAKGEYPNLVRVPEKIMQFQMMIFTNKSDVVVNEPKDLQPYDVGIVTGWKILERNTTMAHSVVSVEKGEQLFTMLGKKRIDIAIIERMIGMKLMKDSGVKNARMLSTPFLSGYWYPYLNKKHEALVPKFAEAIKAIKEDGTYERIQTEVLTRYAL